VSGARTRADTSAEGFDFDWFFQQLDVVAELHGRRTTLEVDAGRATVLNTA